MISKTDPKTDLSPAEQKLIFIVIKHLQGIPNVNWDAVATDYGYKSGALARSKFAGAKSSCKNYGLDKTSSKNEGSPEKASPKRKQKGEESKSKRSPKKAKAEVNDFDSEEKKVFVENIKSEGMVKEEALSEDDEEHIDNAA